MNIRESKANELNAIGLLHESAFAEPEGKAIARLVCEMFNDETARPLLSLVAEENNTIIGHVIFSPVKLDSGKDISLYILAPLAVAKKYQRQGVGTKLINFGLDELRKRGIEIVLVYGDPKYYNRTGFRAGHNIKPPYELTYPEAWMALELSPGVLASAKGVAECVDSLNAPEYW